MTPDKETRWCCRCGVTKPLTPENFGRAASRGLGFIHHCRKCSKPDRRKVAPEWLQTEGGRVWA